MKRYSSITPEMPIPHDKLNWMQTLLVKTGNLNAPFDLAPMIDDGPRQKALAIVGK